MINVQSAETFFFADSLACNLATYCGGYVLTLQLACPLLAWRLFAQQELINKFVINLRAVV